MTVASAKSIEAAQNLLASVETALLMIAANFFPEPEQRRLSIRGFKATPSDTIAFTVVDEWNGKQTAFNFAVPSFVVTTAMEAEVKNIAAPEQVLKYVREHPTA